jgi:hypothetical protein
VYAHTTYCNISIALVSNCSTLRHTANDNTKHVFVVHFDGACSAVPVGCSAMVHEHEFLNIAIRQLQTAAAAAIVLNHSALLIALLTTTHTAASSPPAAAVRRT